MAAKEPRAKQPPEQHGLSDIRGLAKILNQYDLSELEVETNGQRIRIRRERVNARAAEPPQQLILSPEPPPRATPPPPEPEEEGGTLITSPFVGTFYRSPSPETSPFVEIGQAVRKGQVLCIVEAMKLMNEIEAELDCKILDVLAKNSEPVEFGQPLFKVMPMA